MPEKLKDLFFTDQFFIELGKAIHELYPEFDKDGFIRSIFDKEWERRELKQKMRHTTFCLAAFLPENYPEAMKILTEVAPRFTGFDAMVFPDFVECYGLDDWDTSLRALALFTRYCSSEFAIRPFLAQDPEKGMSFMLALTDEKNHHLRRLASEGCRPRLPWAMALSAFRKNPLPIFPILEALRDDPSEYVRRSVANNLNDISKDHPELVLDICEKWLGQSENTDWIVKRACRSLLKSGHKRALLLFGFGDPRFISIEELSLDRSILTIGEDIRFSFALKLETKDPYLARLEYGVYFVKARGKLSRKIFQLREASYEPGSYIIARKHSFKDLSTRKHYPGIHRLAIIVNGLEKATVEFELK